MSDLKPEHRVFAEQYVIDWNGTRAYQVAYPEIDVKSAEASASRLLRNVKVAEYIEEIQKDLAKLAGVSALGNILELKKISLPPEPDSTEPVVTEKTTDRLKAIDMINDMLGFKAPVKTELSGKVNIPLINWVDGDK